MKQTYSLYLLALLFVLPPMGLAATKGVVKSCSSVFSTASFINTAALGYTPQISKSIVQPNGERRITASETSDVNSPILGTFEFRLTKDERVMDIDTIIVYPRVQRKGLSEVMLRQALHEFPRVEVLTTYLMKTNLNEIQNALHNGLSPMQALYASPSYRTFYRAGFTQIDAFEFVGLGYFLIVSKPVVATQ
jgi:N-acetylglutamate synthase-like GNAT family acetyltransferase